MSDYGFPCIYKIAFYDDDKCKVCDAKGIIFAESVPAAVSLLDKWYGNIERICVEIFEDGPIELDEEAEIEVRRMLEGR